MSICDDNFLLLRGIKQSEETVQQGWWADRQAGGLWKGGRGSTDPGGVREPYTCRISQRKWRNGLEADGALAGESHPRWGVGGRTAHEQDWSSPDPWMGSRALSVLGQGHGQCQGNCAHSSGGTEGGHLQTPLAIQQTSQRPQHTYTAGCTTQLWTKMTERGTQPAGWCQQKPRLPPSVRLSGSTLPCLDKSLPILAHSLFSLCKTGFLFFSTCI